MLFDQLQDPSHNQKEKKKNDTNIRALRLASRPLGIYNFTKAYTGHSLSWSIATFEYSTELLIILEVNRGITYEQTLRGPLTAGREKGGDLATTSLESEYLHRKSRCEILIGGDDISIYDAITLGSCHVNVCLHSRSFPLRADLRKSGCSVDGEPQGNWGRNLNSRNVVSSSPSFSRHTASAPWRAFSQAKRGTAFIHQKSSNKNNEGWGEAVLVWNGRVLRYYWVFHHQLLLVFLRRYSPFRFLS